MFCNSQGNSMTTDKTYFLCSAFGPLEQCFIHLITTVPCSEQSSQPSLGSHLPDESLFCWWKQRAEWC